MATKHMHGVFWGKAKIHYRTGANSNFDDVVLSSTAYGHKG